MILELIFLLTVYKLRNWMCPLNGNHCLLLLRSYTCSAILFSSYRIQRIELWKLQSKWKITAVLSGMHFYVLTSPRQIFLTDNIYEQWNRFFKLYLNVSFWITLDKIILNKTLLKKWVAFLWLVKHNPFNWSIVPIWNLD